MLFIISRNHTDIFTQVDEVSWYQHLIGKLIHANDPEYEFNE